MLALLPLLLWAIIPILPTHDDWASTTKPDFSPFFIKEHFLFYGYHWRPFDTWIGYIAGRNPQLLFPAFHHLCVVVGHTLCSCIVFQILTTLGFNRPASNIATLVFYVTPAAMATLFAVDSQNQTFALLWGMMAFLVYIKIKKWKYIVWIPLIYIATLSKENGLMWALICPILAYGFQFISMRTLRRDLLIAMTVMAGYALAILLLPKDIIIHPEYVPEEFKMVKNFVKCLFTLFITIDYDYLLHQPHRNLILAALSLLLTIPFFYMVFLRHAKLFIERSMLCVLLCLLIAVGPHLLTVFSMMHAYAALPFVSIIIARMVNSYGQQDKKKFTIAFCLFLTAAIGIDVHLLHQSVKSGLVGKQMAQEAIRKTGHPVERVFVIIVEDDYPKLSSFCVIPSDAFGWGDAAKHETNYQWPKYISDTILVRSEKALQEAESLAERTLLTDSTMDCIWIVNHQQVEVIRK